jgi:ankyrin repeat protein
LILFSKGNINVRRSDGVTPLFMAAQKGHENIVDLLVKAGR